jgi:hypothetical protein
MFLRGRYEIQLEEEAGNDERIGRRVSVILDGVTLIDREEIPGPIILQGDHGPVSFRNIVLTPAIEGTAK